MLQPSGFQEKGGYDLKDGRRKERGFYQPGAWGLYSLYFETTKVQESLHHLLLCLLLPSGFLSLLSYFLGFLMEYRLQPLHRLRPPLLSLSEWGKERWGAGWKGVPSHPASIHPTSLVPSRQPRPHLQHHHHRHTVACHRIAQFRQDSFRFRDVYRLFLGFVLFVCFHFFCFYNSNNHSTYYRRSLQCSVQTPQL